MNRGWFLSSAVAPSSLDVRRDSSSRIAGKPRYLWVLLVLASTAFEAASAQTFEVVRFLRPAGGAPSGALLRTADGSLYGASTSDGEFLGGTIFALEPNGPGTHQYSVLHDFRPPEGAPPNGGLVLGPGGYFYGTARFGGSAGLGTVFR